MMKNGWDMKKNGSMKYSEGLKYEEKNEWDRSDDEWYIKIDGWEVR